MANVMRILERIHTILRHNIKNKNKEILDAEMWDIFKVLEIAEQKTVTSHPLLIGIFLIPKQLSKN